MSDQRCVCGLTEAEHLTLDLRHTFAAQPTGEAFCLPSCYVDDISSPNYWTIHAEGCPNKPTEEAGTEPLGMCELRGTKEAEREPSPRWIGDEPEFIEASNYGSTETVKKLLDIVEHGQTGKFGGEELQKLADWIVSHRASPRSAAEIRKWIVTRGEFENYDPNATYAITGQQLMAMFESFSGASLRSASWGFSGNMVIVPQEGCVICGESGHPNAICPKAARESQSAEAENFNRNLVIGKIASDLCRKLNVEDKKGWHWNTFIEILKEAIPDSEPSPQSAEAVADKITELCGQDCILPRSTGVQLPIVELEAELSRIWCGSYDDCIKQIRKFLEMKKSSPKGAAASLPGQPSPAPEEKSHKELTDFHLLHRLWSKAVGTPSYVKDEWRRMESIVLRPSQPSEGLEQVAREIYLETEGFTPLGKGKFIATKADEIEIGKILAILARHFSGGKGAERAAQAITKMVDMWLDKLNLPTSNEQGKQIFTQTIQDIIEQCCGAALPGQAKGKLKRTNNNMTNHVIYTVHLPNGKHLLTQERLNQFLHSDKAMQYQDCQIKITVERVK